MFTKDPYVLHLVRVLLPNGTRGLRRAEAIDRLRQIRASGEAKLPKAFERSVQAAFNRHSSQSARFKGPPENDPFYSVGGKRSGTWAVHLDKVGRWLERRATSVVNFRDLGVSPAKQQHLPF
jgi:hypothetical protein